MSEVSLFRAVSFEGMTATPSQGNHDEDVDFMREVCFLAKLSEWLIVPIRLNFLRSTVSSPSVTGTVEVPRHLTYIVCHCLIKNMETLLLDY